MANNRFFRKVLEHKAVSVGSTNYHFHLQIFLLMHVFLFWTYLIIFCISYKFLPSATFYKNNFHSFTMYSVIRMSSFFVVLKIWPQVFMLKGWLVTKLKLLPPAFFLGRGRITSLLLCFKLLKKIKSSSSTKHSCCVSINKKYYYTHWKAGVFA